MISPITNSRRYRGSGHSSCSALQPRKEVMIFLSLATLLYLRQVCEREDECFVVYGAQIWSRSSCTTSGTGPMQFVLHLRLRLTKQFVSHSCLCRMKPTCGKICLEKCRSACPSAARQSICNPNRAVYSHRSHQHLASISIGVYYQYFGSGFG